MGIISTLNDPSKYKTIHKLNRVQLIDDSFSFSQVGDMDYGITFQLLKYLKHEKEYAPWLAALSGLSPINKLMKRTPNQGVFQVCINKELFILFLIIMDHRIICSFLNNTSPIQANSLRINQKYIK